MNDERRGPRMGRKPLDPDDPSVAIQLRVPSRQYDQYDQQARREGISIPELLRRALTAARKKI